MSAYVELQVTTTPVSFQLQKDQPRVIKKDDSTKEEKDNEEEEDEEETQHEREEQQQPYEARYRSRGREIEEREREKVPAGRQENSYTYTSDEYERERDSQRRANYRSPKYHHDDYTIESSRPNVVYHSDRIIDRNSDRNSDGNNDGYCMNGGKMSCTCALGFTGDRCESSKLQSAIAVGSPCILKLL